MYPHFSRILHVICMTFPKVHPIMRIVPLSLEVVRHQYVVKWIEFDTAVAVIGMLQSTNLILLINKIILKHSNDCLDHRHVPSTHKLLIIENLRPVHKNQQELSIDAKPFPGVYFLFVLFSIPSLFLNLCYLCHTCLNCSIIKIINIFVYHHQRP